MSNPFQLIQEFKFTEAVGVLASTNVNERDNIIFQLKNLMVPYLNLITTAN